MQHSIRKAEDAIEIEIEVEFEAPFKDRPPACTARCDPDDFADLGRAQHNSAIFKAGRHAEPAVRQAVPFKQFMRGGGLRPAVRCHGLLGHGRGCQDGRIAGEPSRDQSVFDHLFLSCEWGRVKCEKVGDSPT